MLLSYRAFQTRTGSSLICIGSASALLLVSLSAAQAGDGDPGNRPWNEYTTYYEEVLEYYSRQELEAAAPGLPSALHIDDAETPLEYERIGSSDGETEWIVRLSPLYRTHEKVDAIYHMILILPMPVNAEGQDGFAPVDDAVQVWQGTEEDFVPLVYGGERVLGKRNEVLEENLLPALIGSGEGGIPDLSGTGYAYTIWDAILQYDPDFGERVGGWSSLRYRTDDSVGPPDASDERMSAYVVTWIPAFGDAVPAYAVRVDARDTSAP